MRWSWAVRLERSHSSKLNTHYLTHECFRLTLVFNVYRFPTLWSLVWNSSRSNWCPRSVRLCSAETPAASSQTKLWCSSLLYSHPPQLPSTPSSVCVCRPLCLYAWCRMLVLPNYQPTIVSLTNTQNCETKIVKPRVRPITRTQTRRSRKESKVHTFLNTHTQKSCN